MNEFIWTEKVYDGSTLRFMVRGYILYMDYGSQGKGKLNGWNAIKILQN